MRLKRSSDLGEQEYAAAIAKGLNKAFEPPSKRWDRRHASTRHVTLPVDAEDLKIVVFSDLHRGTWDKADDFRRSHRAYRAALGWYLERGYELWLLGDVEELWENRAKDVIEEYEAVLELEKQFVAPAGPGLRRFYGNHDLDWNKPSRVSKHLAPRWIGQTPVIESVRLQIREHGQDLGLMFFVHGHQGTPGSDTFAVISRLAVRVIWRAAQRSQGWLATTPAESTDVRDKHDRAMLKWAQSHAANEPGQRPVLVAGHTHHPVFPGEPPTRPTLDDVATIQAELDAEEDPALRPEIRARMELVAAKVWEEPYVVPHINPPCYFNTGCCSFPDGDVTCLEISGELLRDGNMKDHTDGRGKIRLLRWLDNNGNPVPHQLAASPLRDVLRSVNESDTAAL